ncbi:ABC transporter permease [Calidifontibacillus oryziterrae]|uniref:ABC transporter permease n=1 Tax=Calidifontibacillus oryziterrae TaxID=1191699 RepID=UPI0002EA176C|nr:ABC transporter permease [Calidifontibacillus oryziterrae]
MNSKLMDIFSPVFSVILGILVGALVMIISGYNPIAGYQSLLFGSFGDSYYIGETIRQVTPYILTGLAVAFAFRTGLFNIGVEGQLLMGWLASVWVGLVVELPKIIHLPLAILAAALAGALWGLVPGYLKARFGVHEVIVTIMMNYIALSVLNAIVASYLAVDGFRTNRIYDSASLRSEFLQGITDYSSLHYGIIVALISAFIMWFIIEKTSAGFELRSVGFNQHASKYAGMKVERNIILAMVISGAFAGTAGAMDGLGTFGSLNIKSGFTGAGFDGIAVALLGGNQAFGIVLAAILFGALKVGALEMPMGAGVPTELVDIVIALIIFFVASSYLIQLIFRRFKKGAN